MQRGILEQYYIETDGDNSWYASDNWLNDDVSVCKWYGCECNNTDIDIVTSFKIQNFKSLRQVPTVLGMLSKLEVLNIDGANIVGTLPSELFRSHLLEKKKKGILGENINRPNVCASEGLRRNATWADVVRSK